MDRGRFNAKITTKHKRLGKKETLAGALSLSLSLTQTHTHTYTRSEEGLRQYNGKKYLYRDKVEGDRCRETCFRSSGSSVINNREDPIVETWRREIPLNIFFESSPPRGGSQSGILEAGSGERIRERSGETKMRNLGFEKYISLRDTV